MPLACEEPQYCGSQAAAVLSTVKLEETTFLPTSIHMLATKYSKNFAMVRLHDRRNVYVDTSHGAHADFDCGSAFCATHLHLVCPFFLLVLVQTVRQRKLWGLREVTREDVLSKPGTAPGETILVGHNESAEEFQVRCA